MRSSDPTISEPVCSAIEKKRKKVTSSKQLFQPYGSSPDVEIQIKVASCFRILGSENFRRNQAGRSSYFQTINRIQTGSISTFHSYNRKKFRSADR
jgi:hypothetical protein